MRRGLGAAALSRIAPHVTLVPPVNAHEDRVPEAVEVLRHAAAASHPLALELGPPATFHPVTPVVYLAVGGDTDGVSALRRSLLSGPLDHPEGRRDDREFVPHVTLDQNIEPERIPAAIEALKHYRAAVTLERVSLLQFDEEQRRWVTLADSALGRPHVAGRGGIEIELSLSSSLDPEASRYQDRQWEAYAHETYGPGVASDEPYAICARISGEIVGVASGEMRGPLCRLGNLIVSPEWRSHGVGRQLVLAVERLAAERGAGSVRLETRVGSRAVKFYEDLGYVATGTLPTWRHGYDFLLMEHVLPDPNG